MQSQDNRLFTMSSDDVEFSIADFKEVNREAGLDEPIIAEIADKLDSLKLGESFDHDTQEMMGVITFTRIR